MSGKLTLVPTPIDNSHKLNPSAFDILFKATEQSNAYFLLEEAKEGRRRWLKWGLPRETIERFIIFNEHNQNKEINQDIIKNIKRGAQYYLISDCGLPGFCDPGQGLVNDCHIHNIQVTSTVFYNSTLLALVLSGYPNQSYFFKGFLPRDPDNRARALKSLGSKDTEIIMDTPYRLKRVLEELRDNNISEICLCSDLNKESEYVKRSSPKYFLTHLNELKREFIICIPPRG